MSNGYVRQDLANEISTGNVITATVLDAELDAMAAAMASVTGHVHDGSAGQGGPITKVGPTQNVVVEAGAMRPAVTNVIDLGTSTFQFKSGSFSDTVNARALTSLERSTLNGVTLGAGSTSAPSLSLTGDATTGWYKSASNQWCFVANGAPILLLGDFGLRVVSGAIQTVGGDQVLVGNGEGIFNLNAGNISTGIIPGPRVDGVYARINGTGQLTAGSIGVGFGNINIGTNNFTGQGPGLTQLNASNLSSGTIPAGRLSGAYSISTLTVTGSSVFPSGSAGSPSITLGSSNDTGIYKTSSSNICIATSGTQRLVVNDTGVAVQNGNFIGDGSGITNLNASSLSSGTIPYTLLGTSNSNRDWVLGRIADSGVGNKGTFAMATVAGVSAISYGQVVGGSSLTVCSVGDQTGSTHLSGSWVCLGEIPAAGAADKRTTMFMRNNT